MDFHACIEQYTDCSLVFAEVSDRLSISEWGPPPPPQKKVKVLHLKKQNDVENEDWILKF